MSNSQRMEAVLSRQLAWIAAADSRLTLVLPLSTAMVGALAAYAPKPDSWTLACGIPAAFALFFLTLSLIFCAFAFFPRTTGSKGSLIFFDGICSRTLDQYQSAITSLEDFAYDKDLIEQCHINANIASTKFAWVKRGMASLFLSVVPWALAIYHFYGIKHAAV